MRPHEAKITDNFIPLFLLDTSVISKLRRKPELRQGTPRRVPEPSELDKVPGDAAV